MRKQSTVVILENKKRINSKDLTSSRHNSNFDNSVINSTNEYLGLLFSSKSFRKTNN